MGLVVSHRSISTVVVIILLSDSAIIELQELIADGLYTDMATVTSSTSAHDLQLLDVNQIADRLGVTPRFIRRLVDERRIPFCKLGEFVRFDVAEVAVWVDVGASALSVEA